MQQHSQGQHQEQDTGTAYGTEQGVIQHHLRQQHPFTSCHFQEPRGELSQEHHDQQRRQQELAAGLDYLQTQQYSAQGHTDEETVNVHATHQGMQDSEVSTRLYQCPAELVPLISGIRVLRCVINGWRPRFSKCSHHVYNAHS